MYSSSFNFFFNSTFYFKDPVGNFTSFSDMLTNNNIVRQKRFIKKVTKKLP